MLQPGQVLRGPLFNEPMIVETVRPAGPQTWEVGLVGQHIERFHRVTLTAQDVTRLTIPKPSTSFRRCAMLVNVR
jgi:hypothetical protein